MNFKPYEIIFILTALCVPLQLDAQTNLIDGTYMRNWLILGPFFPQDLDKDFLEKYGGETNVRPELGDVVQTKDGRELIGNHMNRLASELILLQLSVDLMRHHICLLIY